MTDQSITVGTWFPLWDDLEVPVEVIDLFETIEERQTRRTQVIIHRNNVMNPVLQIQLSNIKNLCPKYPWGVFARVTILFGELIVEYKGEGIDENERLTRYGKGRNGKGRYVFNNGSGSLIDGENPLRSGIARFINSIGPGEESNANVEVCHHDGQLYVECIKHIHVGQELLYDYGSGYEWEEGEQKTTLTTLVPRRKKK
jgi:hypothetical protein